jgi:biotin carboxylase
MTRVLVLNRFDLAGARYAEWMPPDIAIHVLTTAGSVSPQVDLSGYADVQVIEGYRDSGCVDYLADRLHRRHSFDRIVATSEYDLLRAARMSTRWGLPGRPYDEVLRYRDKARMKAALDAHAVPVTRWAAADDVLSLVDAVRALGFPAVVKPRLGAASRGVRIVRGEADLADLVRDTAELAGDAPAGLLVERYVSGTVFHVDGMIHNGHPVLCWPSQTTPNLDLTAGRSLVSTMLEPTDRRLREFGAVIGRAVRALGPPDVGLVHAELFATQHDGLLVNEVGARVGGGRIKEVLRRAFGVDPLEWYIRTLFDTARRELPAVPLVQAGYAKAAVRVGQVRSVPLSCPVPGVVSYYPHVGTGDRLSAPTSADDCVASFVATGATRDQVHAALTEAVSWARDAFDVETGGDR